MLDIRELTKGKIQWFFIDFVCVSFLFPSCTVNFFRMLKNTKKSLYPHKAYSSAAETKLLNIRTINIKGFDLMRKQQASARHIENTGRDVKRIWFQPWFYALREAPPTCQLPSSLSIKSDTCDTCPLMSLHSSILWARAGIGMCSWSQDTFPPRPRIMPATESHFPWGPCCSYSSS